MATIPLTCVGCVALFGTCWSSYNSFVIVAKCINCLLCNKNFVTYGAMFTFGQTCVKAVWCNGFVYCFGVTKCINCLLCNKNFVTCRAMFTFGKTCCCAVWCYCFVYYFGVACCCNFTSLLVIFVVCTNASFVANSCTCCMLCCLPSTKIVAKCCNITINFGVATNGTCVCCVALFGTCWSSYNSFVVVAKCIKCFCFARKFFFANCTICYSIVRTCKYASWSNVVF